MMAEGTNTRRNRLYAIAWRSELAPGYEDVGSVQAIGRLIELWERLTRVWAAKSTPAALVRSIAHRQAA